MNLTIVSYAKGKTGHEQAEAENLRRLSGHGSVAVEVVRNWQQKDGLPQRQLGNTYAISLYVEGRSYTSTALSEHVGELLQRGHSHLVFAIGGADGMPSGALVPIQPHLLPRSCPSAVAGSVVSVLRYSAWR